MKEFRRYIGMEDPRMVRRLNISITFILVFACFCMVADGMRPGVTSTVHRVNSTLAAIAPVNSSDYLVRPKLNKYNLSFDFLNAINKLKDPAEGWAHQAGYNDALDDVRAVLGFGEARFRTGPGPGLQAVTQLDTMQCFPYKAGFLEFPIEKYTVGRGEERCFDTVIRKEDCRMVNGLNGTVINRCTPYNTTSEVCQPTSIRLYINKTYAEKETRVWRAAINATKD
jgi:hypothetical protein